MASRTNTSSASAKSVSAIREMAEQQDQLAKKNYDKGKEAAKRISDPYRPRKKSIPNYTKEKIERFLQNPGRYESDLRKAMHFMYYRSQIMFRIINWYASIWDLRCRIVTPNYNLDVSKNNARKMAKSMNDTYNQLDIYRVHENMYAPLLRAYLDDVVYFLWFSDDEGSFPYILNPDWCRIIGEYYAGDLMFAIDMSNFTSNDWQQFIEWIGSPLKEMYEEYKRTNQQWVKVPDEYAGCFKYRRDDLDICVSPFVPILSQLAALNDLEDIQAIADEQSIFKLLINPVDTISGAKTSDAWKITPDLVVDYVEKMKEQVLPEYVSAAPILGDKLDVIDFTKNSTDAQTDRIKNAQTNLLNVAGGGAVLSAANITSTAAFNAWVQSESEFAISSLMPQVQGFVNRMLKHDVSNPGKVSFFEITVLTRETKRKEILEMNQYSYSMRLALGTLNGFSEKETLANLYFENEVLGLYGTMRYPLQSSFTSSGGETEDGYTNEVGQGRPTVDPGELTPKGDASRNR